MHNPRVPNTYSLVEITLCQYSLPYHMITLLYELLFNLNTSIVNNVLNSYLFSRMSIIIGDLTGFLF